MKDYEIRQEVRVGPPYPGKETILVPTPPEGYVWEHRFSEEHGVAFELRLVRFPLPSSVRSELSALRPLKHSKVWGLTLENIAGKYRSAVPVFILVSPENVLILSTIAVSSQDCRERAEDELHACWGTLDAAGFVIANLELTALFEARKRP